MHDQDSLDKILESALASYADPGPDSDLEARILASLAAAPAIAKPLHRRGIRRWAWALALPVAACALAIWLSQRHTAPLSTASQQAAPVLSRPKAVPVPQAPINATLRVPRRAGRLLADHNTIQASAAELPKKDVFPTPAPLTPQEQALVSVTRDAPLPVRRALLAAQQKSDEPVHIAAIHIPPLQSLTPDQP